MGNRETKQVVRLKLNYSNHVVMGPGNVVLYRLKASLACDKQMHPENAVTLRRFAPWQETRTCDKTNSNSPASPG